MRLESVAIRPSLLLMAALCPLHSSPEAVTKDDHWSPAVIYGDGVLHRTIRVTETEWVKI